MASAPMDIPPWHVQIGPARPTTYEVLIREDLAPGPYEELHRNVEQYFRYGKREYTFLRRA